MKNGPFVKAGLYVGKKIGDGLRSLFRIEFQNDIAHIGFQ
jgi:hypothetical protein